MSGTREEKIALIKSAGSRFMSVSFIKKDGTDRLMQIQPAAIKNHLVGDAASDSAKKATATRKANHPNLYPVYDVGKRAIRSVNLDTIHTIVVGGETHAF